MPRTWLRAVAAVLALTAAVAVVAMAARAPLSRSTPVDAASVRAPVTALFLLLLGAGIIMLGALIVLVWSGRRRKDGAPELVPEPLEMHWIWKLLAILLPFALGAAVLAAALTGARTPHSAARFAGGFGGLSTGRGLNAGRSEATAFVLPSWLPWTVLALVLVAIAAGISFMLWRGPVEQESPPSGAASAAVQAALDALETDTDPRTAVIAAYGAMERTLAEHGATRSRSEAPREFLGRVLVASRATEREATMLTALFEEARFSTHPIPERLRRLASSALTSLRTRLEVNDAG